MLGMSQLFGKFVHLPDRELIFRLRPRRNSTVSEASRKLEAAVSLMSTEAYHCEDIATEETHEAPDFSWTPTGFIPDHENNIIDHTTEKIEFDELDFQHMAELYDAGIRQLDTELGRLFTYLDEAGILEKALIVVVSDHGESLGEHGEWQKFSNFEHVSRSLPCTALHYYYFFFGGYILVVRPHARVPGCH